MILLLFITAVTLLIFYLRWNFTHWQRYGFPYIEPKIPGGVLSPVLSRQQSYGVALSEAYLKSKDKVVGVYLLTRPALMIRDPQIINSILIKDFNSFHDRGVYVDEKHDPMSTGLFFLRGTSWKSLRTKLTPSFSSGKLKAMFGTVEDVSKKLIDHLNEKVPNNGSVELEMKSIITTYAIDIIGSVIFGLELNSFKNPDNEFRRISKQINKPDTISALRAACQFNYPILEMLFQRLGWPEEGPESMKHLVKDTIDHREAHNIVRRDMLQLLLQLRNTGSISTDDNVWSAQITDGALKSMTSEHIAAQLYLFYVAGYETTASTVSFTLYELSKTPEVLKKAIVDVEETLAKYDGKICYDAIQDMKYLDLCIKETIRKYPGLPILNRECTADYPIPDSKLVIKKGTPIIIPLYGLHHDPEYFPDPSKYEPERFAEETLNYNTLAYMPFGIGPRHCIAARMGIVNAKVAVAQILKNFNIEINKSEKKIDFANYGIPLLPKSGVNVTLSKKIPT